MTMKRPVKFVIAGILVYVIVSLIVATKYVHFELFSRFQNSSRLMVSSNTQSKYFNNETKYSRTRYILPILPWTLGLSSLYNGYSRSLMFAMQEQRTIANVPFHNHGQTQEGGLRVQRSFEETFDVKELEKLLPIVNLSEYIKHCGVVLPAQNILIPDTSIIRTKNTNVNTTLENYYKLRSLDTDYLIIIYQNTRHLYKKFLGIQLPAITDFVTDDFNRTADCIGVFPTRDLTFSNEEELGRRIIKHWQPAAYVREMANDVFGTLCGGKYVAVHWRNKTGERCTPINPNGKCALNAQRELIILSRATPDIVDGVIETVRSHQLRCIYVASPPYEQLFVSSLKQKDLVVFTVMDLIGMSKKVAKYKNDNYVLSLLEQLIAEYAEVFISSRTSNWSFYVEYRRDLQKKITVALHEIGGSSLAFTPELKNLL
uniref:GDP-fucose protein O-fucosyltransferase 2 n=1 Tax=Saccoglossus kowalevskii TaxID=10224 RepID=A0ABM0MIB1_SACKO|nr:PREDICTED: uncharacterized protein LOC100373823 [Saccoglossus kowalevskii]